MWPFNKFQMFATTSPKRAQGGGVDGAVSALRRAGYAVVVVDARGTGASFGRRGPALHPREMRDVAEMVRWAQQQPWCNGTVALLGAGTDGATVALAAARGAGADAVATVDAVVDPYTDELAPGGVACTGCLA
jgi:putative CocE/NonD family hydrolase